MARCPSHDWDNFVREQDEVAEREIAWWQANQDRVLALVAAILANPNVKPLDIEPSVIVTRVVEIVTEVTSNAQPL